MCVCAKRQYSLLVFCSVCMRTCVGVCVGVGVGVGEGGYVCAKSQHCTSFL